MILCYINVVNAGIKHGTYMSLWAWFVRCKPTSITESSFTPGNNMLVNIIIVIAHNKDYYMLGIVIQKDF